ncbi:MAG TPA: ATP-binding protein [Polyangiaceae bacterium]|nr:ATP-binding protein [Polyangiaceae bacterium]
MIDDVGLEGERLHRLTQFALDNLADATYWMTQDGTIIYVNEAACHLLGYPKSELIGQRMYNINTELSAEVWPLVWERLRSARKRTFETFHRTKNGAVIPVEISANLFEYEGKEYSCAFVRDVRERKETEARLRQAEKMDAVGQLAGGVAHDFNNQLAAILGYVELLFRRLKHDPDSTELAQRVMQAVDRSAGLTRKLLTFARTTNPIADTVDLNVVVDEVAGIIEHSIDKKISVARTLRAAQPLTVGDVSQLENAILNLALNARDAMPSGGVLTIETDNEEIDGTHQSSMMLKGNPGDYVRVTVTDTGVGMDADTVRRMFEPFFTTKERGKGTGLGLAAVYGTVKNHAGAISVESAVGRGTRVVLYLPVTTASEPAHPRPGSEHYTSLRAHVLVVDDEDAVRETVRRLLESLGCRVTARKSGADAIAFYKNAHDSIDVVLLDMVLPEMSGSEILTALQGINPKVKVLISSGYSFNDPNLLTVKGACGVIQKPYTVETLTKKLSHILGQ